jgi:hypothetical protein
MKAAAALPVKGNRSKSWIKVAQLVGYTFIRFFVFLFFSFGDEAHRERGTSCLGQE